MTVPEIMDDFIEFLPDRLSNVIEDSMAMTWGLGFRCLWVVRHYIGRRDTKAFWGKFNQMSVIYENSLLTIAAAVRDFDTYGLLASAVGVDLSFAQELESTC